MAGTRTAGTFIATPENRWITVHFIDQSGDKQAQTIQVAVDALPADIEAMVAAYVAASNASLWKISDTRTFEGDADPDNAVGGYKPSVSSGVNLLFKDAATLDTFDVRVFAPVDAAMQGTQDIPLLSSDELTDLILAIIALRPPYNLRSAQFTDRRERKNNPKVK